MKTLWRFWSRILATGLVALVAVSCAPSPTPTGAPSTGAPSPAAATPATQPTPVPTAAIARGGVLTFRAHGSLGSLDPLWPGGASEARVVAPMYTRLLSMDREDQLLPLLAKEWKAEANGTVFTFSIRDDVKFHDGKPSTAEDVAYSFKVIISPPKGVASKHKGVFAPVVEKVEALAPHTVRITTKRTVGWFLSHMPIVQVAPKHAHEPKGAEGGFAASGLGSGPFKFKSNTPGVELRLARNENYFKKGLPYLDEIRWFVITDEQAVVRRLSLDASCTPGPGT